jgi:hypothetical protein
MALLEKQLYVKKSGIPGAGKGLFTKAFIPKGSRIVEYKGKRTKWNEVKDDDGKNPYLFYINRNNVIDALPATKTLARYANDARGMVRIMSLTERKCTSRPPKIFLRNRKFWSITAASTGK